MERVLDVFEKSLRIFLRDEKKLIQSGVSERCLCGSLMLVIRRNLDDSEFKEYYSDIEYNRNFDGKIKTIIDGGYQVVNVTCDLIVHSRGEKPERDNLIAIEMKRDSHAVEEKDKDRVRLLALTKPSNDSETFSMDGRTMPEHVCGYLLGVFCEISIGERIVNLEYFVGGHLFRSLVLNY